MPGSGVAPPAPPGRADDPLAAVAALGLPGLHLADPAAVHPLLARLRAVPADATAVLDHPALRAAVERSVDDAEAGLDARPLADAVLGLLGETGAGAAAARPWLGALALPDEDGLPARADELLLPDAALRPLLHPDAPLGVLDPDLAAAVPRALLTALGVLDGFAVLLDPDATGPDHDLDDEEAWWAARQDGPTHLVAVRDLDLVDDGAWSAALHLLAGDRATRAALLDPGGYTAWWLARHARLGGRGPGYWRLPSATVLTGLYDAAPAALDEQVLAAIGVRAGLDVGGPAQAADLLARLADPARRPGPALAVAAHAALAAAVADGRVDPAILDPPEHVRALDGEIADAADATVLDAPWYAAVLPAGELVAGGAGAALADLLDLPLASDVVAAEVEGSGRAVAWAALPLAVLACHDLGLPVPPGEVYLHDVLAVRVRRPAPARHEVPLWRDTAGRWHAVDPVRALPAVLAAHRPGEVIVE